MLTKLGNGVLCNREEVDSAVNSFTDQDKFEGIKRLSGHRAPCCGKHQFPANFMVNT